MAIDRFSLVKGVKLIESEDRGAFHDWCDEYLGGILSSLLNDIPSDNYRVWSVPGTPEGYPGMPNADKLLKVGADMGVIVNFMAWVQDQNMAFCSVSDDDEYYPIRVGYDTLLHAYYGIDERELDKERKALLAHIREQHAGKEVGPCTMKVSVGDVSEEMTIG